MGHRGGTGNKPDKWLKLRSRFCRPLSLPHVNGSVPVQSKTLPIKFGISDFLAQDLPASSSQQKSSYMPGTKTASQLGLMPSTDYLLIPWQAPYDYASHYDAALGLADQNLTLRQQPRP